MADNGLCDTSMKILNAIYNAERSKGYYNDGTIISNVVYSKNKLIRTRGLNENVISATWLISSCSLSMGIDSSVMIHILIDRQSKNSITGSIKKTMLSLLKIRGGDSVLKYVSRKPYWETLKWYLETLCSELNKNNKDDTIEILYADYRPVSFGDILECWYNNAFYYYDDGVRMYVSFATGIH